MVRQLHCGSSLLLALFLFLATALPVAAQDDSTVTSADQPIRIGVGASFEQQLLGTIIELLLQDAGYPVESMAPFSSAADLRIALEIGEIDLYPEYTGRALTLYHGLPVDALPNSATRAYELAKSLDLANDLQWLSAATFNSSTALLVQGEFSERLGESVPTIADLATYSNESGPVTICVDSEFYGRADGLPGLQAAYGLDLPEENILLMDSSEAVSALRDGSCDVAQGRATDGRIAAWDLQVLQDSLDFFHFQQPAPVVRATLLAAYPDLPELLRPTLSALDLTAITELTARIEIGADGVVGSGDEESAETIALSFLIANDLVQPPAIRVGSKEFTEQLLLGRLLVLLLRDAGYEVVDFTGFGGTAQIRQAVEAGELDIYPEYTGTATSLHHGIPATALPTTAPRAYALARSLDAPLDLVWLQPLNFNNTYTLMVRRELADEGLRSIGELATYMNTNDSPLTICVESEFYVRPDGLPGLQDRYEFAFQEENIFVMETSATYQQLREGGCDVAEGFATDGRISAWDFVRLEDSLSFFPFYNPTPVIRKEVLDLNPEIATLFEPLIARLTESAMSELNARVDIGADGELASGDEESVDEVAYSFLRENRLVALPAIAVSVAQPESTHQQLIGQMLLLLLADAGYQAVDKRELTGGAAVRRALLTGEVDLYIESIVTALSEYNNLPLAALPTTEQRAYLLIQTLDEPNGVTWLNRMQYSEIQAIATLEALETESIESLEDLARYTVENDDPLSICMDSEFYASEFNGLTSLETLYDFRFEPEDIYLMDRVDIFAALENGECNVAALPRLDATARGYRVLSDPLAFFLDFGSAPVLRTEVLEQNPELLPLLEALTIALDEEALDALVRQVELGTDGEAATNDEVAIEESARRFLMAAGLLAEPAPAYADPETEEEAADASTSTDESTDVPADRETDDEAAAEEPVTEEPTTESEITEDPAFEEPSADDSPQSQGEDAGEDDSTSGRLPALS